MEKTGLIDWRPANSLAWSHVAHRYWVVYVIAALVVVGIGRMSRGDEWPMFMHDPEHTGESKDALGNPDEFELVWESPGLGSGAAYTIAVSADFLYVGSCVWCLDKHDGTRQWLHRQGPLSYSCPAVSEDSVYVGARNGYVYCVNRRNGQVKWQYLTRGCVDSAPAVCGDAVYIGSDDHYIYCLGKDNGAVRWRFETGHVVMASPAVCADSVYCGSHDGRFYCLDRRTGEKKWEWTTGGAPIGGSAVVSGDWVYFASWDNHVYCLSRYTGDLRWRWAAGTDIANQSPAVSGEYVYIGSREGSFHCLYKNDGVLKWRYQSGGSASWSPPVVSGDLVLVATESHVYGLDKNTGTGRWQAEGSSVAAAGGILYVWTGNGIKAFAERATLAASTLQGARDALQAGNFRGARRCAERARDLFRQMRDIASTSRVEAFLKQVAEAERLQEKVQRDQEIHRQQEKRRSIAESLMGYAEALFRAPPNEGPASDSEIQEVLDSLSHGGKYGRIQVAALKARAMFEELNDTDGIERADRLLQRLKRRKTTRTIVAVAVIGGSLVLVAVAVIIGSWVVKKRRERERAKRLKDFEEQKAGWKALGYNVSRLAELRPEEMERARRSFEADTRGLEESAKALEAMDAEGFEEEIEAVRKELALKDPEKAGEIRDAVAELQKKVSLYAQHLELAKMVKESEELVAKAESLKADAKAEIAKFKPTQEMIAKTTHANILEHEDEKDIASMKKSVEKCIAALNRKIEIEENWPTWSERIKSLLSGFGKVSPDMLTGVPTKYLTEYWLELCERYVQEHPSEPLIVRDGAILTPSAAGGVRAPAQPATGPVVPMPTRSAPAESSATSPELTSDEQAFYDYLVETGGEYSRTEAANMLSRSVQDIVVLENVLRAKGLIE